VKRLAELKLIEGINDWHFFYGPYPTLIQGLTPIGLHCSMFMISLKSLTDDDQYKEWVPKAIKLDGILGAYVQTELGHGSNV